MSFADESGCVDVRDAGQVRGGGVRLLYEQRPLEQPRATVSEVRLVIVCCVIVGFVFYVLYHSSFMLNHVGSVHITQVAAARSAARRSVRGDGADPQQRRAEHRQPYDHRDGR